MGERWHQGVHQVWVHVLGEGAVGGHWEDDLDENGVAASVDDDFSLFFLLNSSLCYSSVNPCQHLCETVK